MPLSVNKLEIFLQSKGYIMNNFYIMDGTCFYIEIFCLETAEIFFIYIPSKYNIVPRKEDSVYKIKYINVEENLNENDKENIDIENIYGNLKIDISEESDEMEEKLENNYKHSIRLNEISLSDITDLKSIYRQVKRLKYCVQNLNYKLGILYKNYICAIRRDDSIDCFTVKNFPPDKEKQLMIIIDLESFYDKTERIVDNIRMIKQSIYKILDRNKETNNKVFEKIINNKKEIILIPHLVEKRKEKYDKMISDLEEMLNTMNNVGKTKQDEIDMMDKNVDMEDTIYTDINQAHLKKKLDKELVQINSIRGEIGKYLYILRTKKENAILSSDKIMFDNTIMFDTMIKNFSKLKDLC